RGRRPPDLRGRRAAAVIRPRETHLVKGQGCRCRVRRDGRDLPVHHRLIHPPAGGNGDIAARPRNLPAQTKRTRTRNTLEIGNRKGISPTLRLTLADVTVVAGLCTPLLLMNGVPVAL